MKNHIFPLKWWLPFISIILRLIFIQFSTKLKYLNIISKWIRSLIPRVTSHYKDMTYIGLMMCLVMYFFDEIMKTSSFLFRVSFLFSSSVCNMLPSSNFNFDSFCRSNNNNIEEVFLFHFSKLKQEQHVYMSQHILSRFLECDITLFQ